MLIRSSGSLVRSNFAKCDFIRGVLNLRIALSSFVAASEANISSALKAGSH